MYRIFDTHAARYERWFEKNQAAYLSEIEAVRALLPEAGRSMEIGAGSGRFAVPLGISEGVEPSAAMRRIARERGMNVVDGVGEALPFEDFTFGCVLMVTTICFLDDPFRCVREAWRVLQAGGALVIGFVDKASFLGQQYERTKEQNVFYRDARFFSTNEVIGIMQQAGFGEYAFVQTLFRSPGSMREIEPVRPGYGDGAFVVVRAVKIQHERIG
jgi:SAM-dependent methyltransferase